MLHINPKKIAIFRALQIGDLLCSIPAIRALKTAYPEAEITLIGLSWAKEFVKRFKHYFSDFIEFPGFPGLPERDYKPPEVVEFIKDMQRKEFDLVFQMQGNGSIVNPLIELFGAKVSAGFYRKEDYCPSAATFMPYSSEGPEIRRHLKLMEFLKIPVEDEHLEFPVFESDFNELGELPKNYVCIHPGAKDKERRWEVKNFAKVGDYLSSRGFEVVLTGAENEKFLTQEVANHMRHKPIDLAGKTSLGGVGALLKNASFLVSNCTGVSHIADALDVPSVIVFLTSDPNRWGPINQKLHRRVLKSKSGDYLNVIKEVEELYEKQPA